jgi:hypothetical protein
LGSEEHRRRRHARQVCRPPTRCSAAACCSSRLDARSVPPLCPPSSGPTRRATVHTDPGRGSHLCSAWPARHHSRLVLPRGRVWPHRAGASAPLWPGLASHHLVAAPSRVGPRPQLLRARRRWRPAAVRRDHVLPAAHSTQAQAWRYGGSAWAPPMPCPVCPDAASCVLVAVLTRGWLQSGSPRAHDAARRAEEKQRKAVRKEFLLFPLLRSQK